MEGVKEKLTEATKHPTEVSEASVNKSNKESGDVKPSADELSKQLPGKLEQDATSKSKLAIEQQELATAESSVAVDLTSLTDQQKLVTSDSSVNELHVTTSDNKLQSKEDLSKLTPTDISQQKSEEISRPISQHSSSEETAKTEALSNQQAEKEFKSAVKTTKEETEKVLPDKSVKPKTQTVIKKEVSEKQGTDSRESSSFSKLDIQSTTSSKRKEEQKSISAKDAKALFQSQAAAASGPSTSSNLSDAKSKSTSYSALPGSSSPSSGYLATGTKSIATGSFSSKVTEEYVKKKPLPRNRPFFNLRDFL